MSGSPSGCPSSRNCTLATRAVVLRARARPRPGRRACRPSAGAVSRTVGGVVSAGPSAAGTSISARFQRSPGGLRVVDRHPRARGGRRGVLALDPVGVGRRREVLVHLRLRRRPRCARSPGRSPPPPPTPTSRPASWSARRSARPAAVRARGAAVGGRARVLEGRHGQRARVRAAAAGGGDDEVATGAAATACQISAVPDCVLVRWRSRQVSPPPLTDEKLMRLRPDGPSEARNASSSSFGRVRGERRRADRGRGGCRGR